MIDPLTLQDADDYNLPEAYHALVLLIDDQAFVSDAVRRAFLHQPDIDYHYCASPGDALAVANHFKPTVILLDLVMPEVSGLTLLREFRQNPGTRETPIVVLSAKEEARAKSEAFALGANDYLVKLPDIIELRARVRYHSKAHLNRIAREEAFRALRESQQQLVKKNAELYVVNQDYAKVNAELRSLEKLLPICGCCKAFRDDEAYRQQIAEAVSTNPGLLSRKSLCPRCLSQEQEFR